jgi:hypothetical protein
LEKVVEDEKKKEKAMLILGPLDLSRNYANCVTNGMFTEYLKFCEASLVVLKRSGRYNQKYLYFNIFDGIQGV